MIAISFVWPESKSWVAGPSPAMTRSLSPYAFAFSDSPFFTASSMVPTM